MNTETLIYRLRKRAEIRRNILTRKSVKEGKPDRISDLLEEAANNIEEALQLLDSAKICVELWHAEYPSQKLWKENWLNNAEKYITRNSI